MARTNKSERVRAERLAEAEADGVIVEYVMLVRELRAGGYLYTAQLTDEVRLRGKLVGDLGAYRWGVTEARRLLEDLDAVRRVSAGVEEYDAVMAAQGMMDGD